MTVPSITGSITNIQSNGASGSQSITVPADATFALVLTAFWESGVPDYSTLTLNSVGFTKVVENASDSYECSNIYRLENPATGSQTFAWSWASAPDEGAHIFVVFLKDVNTSAPITGSNYGQAAPSSGAEPSLPTGTFSSTTNDLCLMVASVYGATAGNGTVLSQTEVADGGVYSSTYGLVATKPGVSGTTTMDSAWTGSGMSGSACACSVAGSVGGGEVNITVAEGSQTQTSDAAVITAIHGIAPAEATQAQTSEPASLTNVYPTYNITPAEGSQSQTSEAATLAAIYPIAPAEASQAQTSEAASLSVVGATNWTTYWTTLFDQDQEAWVTLAHIAGTIRLWGRIVNPTGGGVDLRGYFAQYQGGTVTAHRYNDATSTNEGLGTASVTLSDGDKLWLRLEGAQVSVYTYQASTWTQQINVTDASPALEDGYIGIEATDATAALDDFGGGSLSVEIAPAEGTQSQISDAVGISSIHVIAPAEGTQSQTSEAASITFDAGTVNITVAEGTQTQVSDAAVISDANCEHFETEAGWIVETDTSGTGSTVARSDEQEYAGSYSAKCFTTNTGAKAQVRDIISSPWSGVSADTNSYIWQRAYIYVPTATADAITGTEYIDLGGLYVSGDASGWYLRMMAGAALYGVGPGSSGQAVFNLYGTFPLDQWVEVEIGLWSRASGDLDRAGCFIVNGKFYGWFTNGVSGTDYDRAAMGIVATNSADDLTVYVDDWYIYTTGTAPVGTDNRPTTDSHTHDYTALSGENIGYHYTTWENGYTFNATYGLTPTGRIQSGIEHSLMPDMSDGWSQIVIDWNAGATPSWPPDNGNGNFYFPMVGFRKSVALEENLEIVPIYRPGGTPTVDLVYESWTIGAAEYAEWELPVDHTSGQRIPGRGDIIRVRWQEVSATEIRVRADYYDASAATWYLDVIDDTRALNNVSGVNFLADTHRAITNTIDSNDYTIKSQTVGLLSTFSEGIAPAEGTQTQSSDAAVLTAITPITPAEGTQSQTSDAAVLVGIHVITPAEGTQIQTSDLAVFGQYINVTAAQGEQSQVSDAATLTAIYPIAAAENTQSQLSDAAGVTFNAGGDTYNITGAEGTQAQASDPAILAAIYQLTPIGGEQAQTSEAATLTVIVPVTPAEGTQSQISDAALISFFYPTYEITAAEGTQSQTSDAVTLTAIYVITVADATQTQTSDAVTVSNYGIVEPGERRVHTFPVRGDSVFGSRPTHSLATREDLEVDD